MEKRYGRVFLFSVRSFGWQDLRFSILFCANCLLKSCLIILACKDVRYSEVTHFELTIVVDEDIIKIKKNIFEESQTCVGSVGEIKLLK